MSGTVLIISRPGDEHAYAVAEALERKAVSASVYLSTDFPARSEETAALGGGRMGVTLSTSGVTADQLTGIWFRRPQFVLDVEALHPADRECAALQCQAFREGLFRVLAPAAFWVSPPDAARRADLRLWQQRVAQDVGFATPASVYTNDPEAIRSFIRSHPGGVVHKQLRRSSWQDATGVWRSYTSRLEERDLVPDDLLRAVPAIYQELVPKAYELRVTMIGRRAFAARLLSQETSGGRVDYRLAYDELAMEPWRLPADVERRCRSLLSRMGLVFGCCDLIVTPAGEHVFLEVNEQGQFLFVEEATGLPLLDAFSELLSQGRADYEWEETDAAVRYPDLAAVAAERARRSLDGHVAPLAPVHHEGAAAPASP